MSGKKLLDRVRDTLRRKNYAYRTERLIPAGPGRLGEGAIGRLGDGVRGRLGDREIWLVLRMLLVYNLDSLDRR